MLGRSRVATKIAALATPRVPLTRFAHAARLPADDEQPAEAGPSRTRRARPSHKGKERVVDSDYRFPEKGRNGGPPNPYEVLGLERSASDSEIKQTCKLIVTLDLIGRLPPSHDTPSGF